MNRRDPLVVMGFVVVALLLLMMSVLGRMFLFLRFVSVLLLVGLLVLGLIIGYRFYYKRQP